MTKTALRSAGQTGTRHRNRDGAAGPLTRMAHNQAPTGRQAAEPRLTRMEGSLVRLPGSGLGSAIAAAPNGKWLAALFEGQDGKAQIWDTTTWRLRPTLDCGECTAIAISPDSKWLITGG